MVVMKLRCGHFLARASFLAAKIRVVPLFGIVVFFLTSCSSDGDKSIAKSLGELTWNQFFWRGAILLFVIGIIRALKEALEDDGFWKTVVKIIWFLVCFILLLAIAAFIYFANESDSFSTPVTTPIPSSTDGLNSAKEAPSSAPPNINSNVKDSNSPIPPLSVTTIAPAPTEPLAVPKSFPASETPTVLNPPAIQSLPGKAATGCCSEAVEKERSR